MTHLSAFGKTIAMCSMIVLSTPAMAAPPALNFTVNMSEAVNVNTGGGTPRIAINVDGQTRYATYSAGTGTSSLTFSYAPTIGDLDLDGIAISSPLDLNGGTITDLAGNLETDLTFTVPNTSGIKIDYPSLSMDFVYDADGRYTFNGTAYDDLPSFLSAAGGSFTRASTATYFDSTGTLQTASNNVPRFDHDPITHTAKGILIEEARTNYIWNSQANGAVSGSPGTLPIYWMDNSGGGTTNSISIAGTGLINGMNYVDLNFQGTNATNGWISVVLNKWEHATSVSGGQTVSASAYIALIAGTLPSNTNFFVSQYDSGASYITNMTAFSISSASITSSLTYISGTATTDANAATLRSPRLLWGNSGAPYAYNFTIRLAAPQMEFGAFPTSYIPTTTSAVTRQQDRLTIPTSSWYNAASQTLWGKAYTNGVNPGSAATLADINNNSFNERFQIRFQGGPLYGGIITSAGSVQSILFGGSLTFGQTKSISLTSSTNDATLSADGNIITTDSSVVMPTAATQLRIGAVANGVEMLNGGLEQLKYYPTRISDAQLQLLTQ